MYNRIVSLPALLFVVVSFAPGQKQCPWRSSASSTAHTEPIIKVYFLLNPKFWYFSNFSFVAENKVANTYARFLVLCVSCPLLQYLLLSVGCNALL